MLSLPASYARPSWHLRVPHLVLSCSALRLAWQWLVLLSLLLTE